MSKELVRDMQHEAREEAALRLQGLGHIRTAKKEVHPIVRATTGAALPCAVQGTSLPCASAMPCK